MRMTGRPGSFLPPNRLGAILSAPGGLDAREALERASRALDAGEAARLARIDDVLAEMRALAAGPPPPMADQLRMYDLASEIVSLAATAPSKDIAAAAYSLCELLDRQTQNNTWLVERVRVHLAALAALRTPASTAKDADYRATILEGLRALSSTA